MFASAIGSHTALPEKIDEPGSQAEQKADRHASQKGCSKRGLCPRNEAQVDAFGQSEHQTDHDTRQQEVRGARDATELAWLQRVNLEHIASPFDDSPGDPAEPGQHILPVGFVDSIGSESGVDVAGDYGIGERT